MKRLTIVSSLMFLVVLISPIQASGEETIAIQCQIFRVMGTLSGDTSLDGDIWAGGEAAGAKLTKALTLFTHGHFRLGEDVLEITKNGWFWNGACLDFGRAEEMGMPENQIQVIASPAILIESSESATIFISSNQKLEYFEKREDGLFELKHIQGPTGLKIEIRAESEGQNKIRIKYLTFSLRSVEEREPIPNVTLPVGRPILESREFKVDIEVTPGKDYGFILHPGQGQGVLIIRLRLDLITESLNTQQTNEK